MLGFQSMMARRNSDKLSDNPSGNTSCPAARRCVMTSYSVRHSSISFSVAPTRDSGGTRVECTSTKVRNFLTAPLASPHHPHPATSINGRAQSPGAGAEHGS